jgi:riboflavin kinase/FMN adenylyltransferase
VRILRNLHHVPESLRRGAVAIGNFDGVHVGHARIAARLVASARQLGKAAVVFTFDPHPVRILRPHKAPPPLTWTDRKAALLAELGVDAVVAYPTDEALLRLDAREFFDEMIRRRLDARAIVEGANFLFGRGRQGNVELLRQFCREAGIQVEVVEPVQIDGEVVSSSRVRALIAGGDVDPARRMLTRPYRVCGTVIHGAGRGARLGYPTANLAAIGTLVPGEGIYAGQAWADERAWPAAISVGPNPTFDEGGLKVEAYLIGYDGDLYDRLLDLDFLLRLRAVERFPSVDALLAQMDQDVARARTVADEHAAEDDPGNTRFSVPQGRAPSRG